MAKCNSCSYEGSDFTKFACPKCSELISRCSKCKTLSVEYKCKKCGFKGP